jgi:hypothetical protein
MKGDYNDICYRKVCDEGNAIYYNSSTRKFYCKDCARWINEFNPGLCQKEIHKDIESPKKLYTLYLDNFIEEIFYELEQISDGGVSHRCEILAENEKQAADILADRLKSFLMKSFEVEEGESDEES